MTELTGHELEDFGQEVFARMGLVCVHRLRQARLKDIDPSGPYSESEHLEFDYLIPIPYVKTCLIGEITGRHDPSDVRSKYDRFRRHYDAVRKLLPDENIWRLLGVPDEQLTYFQEAKEFRGFFITTCLQRFDVNLPDVPNIIRFYKADWELLKEYSEVIGTYAKPYLFGRFNIEEPMPRESLTLRKDYHNLIRIPNKRIASGEVGLANVYTFEASPYELLPMAHVYRRDELPSLSSRVDEDYQRPLIPEKLEIIRNKLRESPDFMFPNNILVVLSSDCEFMDDKQILVIPKRYGAIEVIDGQHRLFAYADESLKSFFRKRMGKILKKRSKSWLLRFNFKTSLRKMFIDTAPELLLKLT